LHYRTIYDANIYLSSTPERIADTNLPPWLSVIDIQQMNSPRQVSRLPNLTTHPFYINRLVTHVQALISSASASPCLLFPEYIHPIE